jgi:hypothetical protein
MRLVGVTGRARSGKDTFAQGLIRHGYRRAAFADALKQVTALIANEPPELFFDEVTKEEFSPNLGMTRRKALQLLGTEGIRKVLGDNVWVDRLLRSWREDGMHATVITDVRFDNEARAIAELGGHIVLITRPDNVGLQGSAATHASERGVSEDLIDLEVVNDGSVAELWAEAAKLRALLDRDSA